MAKAEALRAEAREKLEPKARNYGISGGAALKGVMSHEIPQCQGKASECLSSPSAPVHRAYRASSALYYPHSGLRF